MEKKDFIKYYKSKKEDYNRLGQNIVEALKTFLFEADIPFLEIYYRVKKLDSIIEKIERKSYKNPVDEIEDICGIRIICYYISDIKRINEIINTEFTILEQQDKSNLLGLKEFAYRSNHYIVKINDSWLVAPNYRKLDGLKAEIQVRTILMHAWAEIEHKLNYKSDAQVPDRFQRKLFRLSAKFEEADEQFEELKEGINNYKEQLIKTIKTTKKFNLNQDFNIDSFKAFIKYHFPDDNIDDLYINYNFEEYSKYGKDFKTLNNALLVVKPYFSEIIKDLKKSGYIKGSSLKSQIGLLGIAMDIVDDESFKRRKDTIKEWRDVVVKWRKKIKAGNNV